jgi:hypothetical protein
VTSAQQLPENATTTAKATRTEYVVLREVDREADGWAVELKVKATSAEAAIKAVAVDYAQAAGHTDDRFVAVPARSWQPRTVSFKTETKAVLS